MKKVIAGGDDRHGTGIAFSFLPAAYEGPCRMTYQGRLGKTSSVVFVNRSEAGLAATFAVQPDRGGYRFVEVTVASIHEVTHALCIDWICDCGQAGGPLLRASSQPPISGRSPHAGSPR